MVSAGRTEKIKILLVDDDELFQKCLTALLEKEANIDIVGRVSSGEDALRVMREKAVNLVLLDLGMPGMGGLEATKRLLTAFPKTRLLVLSGKKAAQYPVRLIKMGASGFVTKSCTPEELIMAIQKVMAGEYYVSPKMAQSMLLQNVKEDVYQKIIEALPHREFQVFEMIGMRQSVEAVAKQLNIEVKTVAAIRNRLLKKFGVTSDIGLSYVGIKTGYVVVDLDEM